MAYIKLLLIILTLNSCKGQNDTPDLKTTWYEIKKQDNNFIILDCGYEGESFKIENDSLFEHGVMEDSSFKIDHITSNDNIASLYIDQKDKYSISWVNKSEGIIKRISSLDQNLIKYFVNKKNADKIRKVKGTNKDCITSEDFEIEPPEKLTIKNSNSIVNGLWKTNCSQGVSSITIDGKNASMIVQYNQIYIDMIETKRFNSENGIAYRLKEIPNDSGSFGSQLPWKDYLNEETIAYLKVIDKNHIYFYWYGFYNKKSKSRDLLESGFQQENNSKDIILTRCE